jgi:hypothetical protein
MALYGAIPFIASHTRDGTTGLFYMNPCETFVDVKAAVSTGHLSRRDKSLQVNLDRLGAAGPVLSDPLAQRMRSTGRLHASWAEPTRRLQAIHHHHWYVCPASSAAAPLVDLILGSPDPDRCTSAAAALLARIPSVPLELQGRERREHGK